MGQTLEKRSDYEIGLYVPGIQTYYSAEYEKLFPDSLNKDSEYKILSIETTMKIAYRNDKFKPKISKINFTISHITLDENGYPIEPNPYKVRGYWATIGVSNLLPRNYEPQN